MYLGSQGSQPLPGGESDSILCIVARELCLFVEVDAGKIPDKKRQAFVDMSVRRLAPFPDPGLGIAWNGSHASVWYWSQSRLLDLLGGQWPRRIKCVPEALYTGAPEEDAQQLLALENGFEGRIWRQHRLVASRWWSAGPSASDWQAFLRGAGMSTAAPPEAVPAPLGIRQWSGTARATPLPLAGLDQHMPRIGLALGAVLVIVLGIELGNMLRAGIDIFRSRQAAQSLDEPLARILAARERADAMAADIQELVPLRGHPPQTLLMAEAARTMQGKDWQLKTWQQPVPGRIEVVLSMAQPDPEFLVTAWEASPLFRDVSTELSRQQNEITIRANVAGAADAEARTDTEAAARAGARTEPAT